ncbi:hypothetical protein BH09VER1_BH09VER1_21070 [soil metagenome]
MDDDLISQLPVDPEVLLGYLTQLLLWGLPFTILCIWATRRVTQRLTGKHAAFWLLFIWIVPILGPIFALIATRKPLPKEPDDDF